MEPLSGSNVPRITQLGAIMADETRVRILDFLLGTQAATSELVVRLGVDQPRVSAHLAALKRMGLVSVSVVGRQHVYAIRSDKVADAIRSFFRLANLSSSAQSHGAVEISKTALREVGRDSPLRRARTCYDHLAGVAGVELLDEMLRRGWVEERKTSGGARTCYTLTRKGRNSLERLNVPLAARIAQRQFAYGCLDWTERRHHLGGFLGKVILDRLLTERIVERTAEGTRAVNIRRPIAQWFTPH
jgi:DNA-binding transcriptional ArsR family regulator/DNA-binding PadR family transcriptional regulator